MDLRAEDSTAFIPSLRATYTFLPSDASRLGAPLFGGGADAEAGRLGDLNGTDAQGAAPKRVRAFAPSLALDLDVARSSGSDTETLQTNEFIEHGNLTLNGPATVDVDFRLERAALALRGGFRIKDRFALEGRVGVAGTQARTEIQSAGFHDTFTTAGVGGLLGAEISVRLVGSWTIYVRGDYSQVDSDSELSTLELGMRALLWQHVGVFAGWTEWEFEDEQFASTIDLKLSGPMLGLQFAF